MNITDVYIADAILNNNLTISEHDGRYGKYFVIGDKNGMIETALTEHEVNERVMDIKKKLGMYDV